MESIVLIIILALSFLSLLYLFTIFMGIQSKICFLKKVKKKLKYFIETEKNRDWLVYRYSKIVDIIGKASIPTDSTTLSYYLEDWPDNLDEKFFDSLNSTIGYYQASKTKKLSPLYWLECFFAIIVGIIAFLSIRFDIIVELVKKLIK